MPNQPFIAGWPALALAATLCAASPWAQASDDDRPLLPASTPKAYTQECASCHVAFPPGMLPVASWQRLMAGLERHFGSDASMEAATARQIEGWLLSHGGSYKRVTGVPPDDRITRSDWFLRKHRKVEPATWQLPSVKTASNCAACHAGTESGIYDDDHLRFPEGLSQRQRLRWD